MLTTLEKQALIGTPINVYAVIGQLSVAVTLIIRDVRERYGNTDYLVSAPADAENAKWVSSASLRYVIVP